MSDNVGHIMDVNGSDMMAPVCQQQGYDANVDFVITEYMDRLGTRLNILETELKYAWRALDLLSQEYIKMWERLEKLEGLLYEQQSVISQLLDFYTSGGSTSINPQMVPSVAMLEGRLGELAVIREILGNGTVEDGLEEGLDISRSHGQIVTIEELEVDSMEEINMPDEAFYRSLNQAYREDLVCGDPCSQVSQLGMIWEEREENEDDKKINDGMNELFSALEYKNYRGNSPCISEQDIAQLSRIDHIDQVAIEKLNELDRLSNKLHRDSLNIKQLQRKLLESPMNGTEEQSESKELDNKKDNSQFEEIFEGPENWSFSSGVRDQDELMILANSDLPNSLSNLSYTTRPSSRLSVVNDTDKEVADALAGGIRTPTSPRRRQMEVSTCTAPFTTVTGRLAYSAAVQHVECAEAAAAAAASNNPFYCSTSDLNSLLAASYEQVACTTPIFNIKSERAQSPTLSICSVRTKHDDYVSASENIKDVQMIASDSPSPPPPAPKDICETYLIPANSQTNTNYSDQRTNQDCKKVLKSPKTLRSPKSPNRSKSHSSNIVAAKSDSGLSSMSGWSSLEKSPGSPKNGSTKHNYGHTTILNNLSAVGPVPLSSDTKPYTESSLDSKVTDASHPIGNSILPGGHHLSAFTTVKSPCSLDSIEGYGTFVPAPAPSSDINVSPRKKHKQKQSKPSESMTRNNPPAIYSVAGSNRKSYIASVYTSNSADYINNYPDLVEPYENNEYHAGQRQQMSSAAMPFDHSSDERKKSLSRSYSTNKGPEGLANHGGYKIAMYRTMFPSGNITDALSYYPTSSRYDSAMASLPQADYNDPMNWLTCQGQYQESASTSSSIKSVDVSDPGYNQSPYMERRQNEQRILQQPIYENQQQIDQQRAAWNQRQEIPYLELDLRNRNVPEYVIQQQQQQQYEQSGLLMSQAGYIIITQDIKQEAPAEKIKSSKILRKGQASVKSIKSAMSSVSHYLPDLHIKRNRSYSLPSGTKKDVEKSKNSYVKNNVLTSKKKKNTIVSTMTGILQKARRKSIQSFSQSLSDPEQSENEWNIQRTSSLCDDGSEDSCSIFSENQFETDMFAKINNTKPKLSKNSISQSSTYYGPAGDDDLQSQFEQIKVSPQLSDRTKVTDPDSCTGEEDYSGKSTGSGASNLFQTVVENKRSSGSSEKSDETVVTDGKMVVVVGGSSMEFAVSRALGKYRQRQTNSISDDQICNGTEQGLIIQEIEDTDKSESKNKFNKLSEQISTESQNSDKSRNDQVQSEGSPASSTKLHINRFLPRHQQSLEIPGQKEYDDDSRSTHSWRSTSRVSSRRQSTEDSIDSEDEWYCYELRKLEEMERQKELEQEMGETLQELPEPNDAEDESYDPCEDVKERMSFVLRELRIKAKVINGVMEEKDNQLHTLQSAQVRERNRGSFQLDNAASLFQKITNYHGHEDSLSLLDLKLNLEPEVKKEIEEDRRSRSSGDTSGPDSPHISNDEYDETEMAINDEFARCHISKEMHEVNDNKVKHDQKGDAAIPKINVEEGSAKDEEQKEQGPLGSKWKLLKTLKEKKAEEKSFQGKSPEIEKEKVSSMGIENFTKFMLKLKS